MNIIQITPAAAGDKSGNRVTALRWSRLLRELGHRVATQTAYHGEPAQLMIALHAWRSRVAIARFHACYPDRPLIVALTGTDINEYLHLDPDSTLPALAAADVLVCFHDLVRDVTPVPFRRKLYVIHQSTKPFPPMRAPARRSFNVCVIGHLRDIKDPLRTALAARNLPAASRIRVVQLGKSLDPRLTGAALAEMKNNPRYRWKGEVARREVRRELARSRLMVISSLAEGGANVISEAVMAGVPVAASRIDGNVGLLGKNYAGYFPVGDTEALRELLVRCEQSPSFLAGLERQCAARRHLFTPEREQARWRLLLERLGA